MTTKMMQWLAAAAVLACGAAQAAAPTRGVPASPLQPEKLASTADSTAVRVLLLQDVAPCGMTSNEEFLNNHEVAFDLLSSAALATIDFAAYTNIVVASDQPQSFYDALSVYMPTIKTWVKQGRRTLEFHGADNGRQLGHWNFKLPNGVSGNMQVFDAVNLVVNPASPLVKDSPATINGQYASHDSLNLGPVSSSAVVVTDSSGAPTLIDYCYGKGRVVVTGMTWEFYFGKSSDDSDPGRILRKTLKSTTGKPGCLE